MISLGTGLIGWVAWIVLLTIYLLPTLVASLRHHHQTAAILLTNVLLGWTALGWIAALIWSVTATQRQQQVVYVTGAAPVAGPAPSIDASASQHQN